MIEGEDEGKKLWKFNLYAMKVEIALYDFKQNLYWQSVIEAGIMVCAFIALLTSGSLLFFMHLVHLIRPYVARWILRKLPKTHEILELVREDIESAKEQAHQLFVDQFQAASTFYSHYFILSAVGAVFDTLSLIYNLSNTGGSMDAYMFYLNTSIVFVIFDFHIILWSKSLIFSFPVTLWNISKQLVEIRRTETSDMLNGFLNNMVKDLK